MRKILIVLLVTALGFSFAAPLSGAEKNQGVDVKQIRPGSSAYMDSAQTDQEQAKWNRYLDARNRKEQKHRRYITMVGMADGSQMAQPNDASIALVSNSTNWVQDSFGDLVWMGRCINNGASGGTFVRVDIDVYDASNNLLGSDFTYVWGGRNVHNGYGLYYNAIEAGGTGFFRIWTNISYSQAHTIYYTFTWYNYSYYYALAWLDFYTGVYSRSDYWGDMEFYGNVMNYSTNYLTYFTQVAFACMNTSRTYPRDVDYDYVTGTIYGTSIGAIEPGEMAAFEVDFPFANYSGGTGGYYKAFEWDEVTTGGGLAEQNPPFGEFATPVNGANVASSIAVTGWALDDTGVDSVKIYRGETGSLTYVGDAIFVEGARPDIAAANPLYPRADRAGWGYMLLTNFLPNGGNGTYKLHAIATDLSGKQTTLGSSTIYCDNANAVKPFGAIDTPFPGGTASGPSFRNVGWALTPMPNSLPTDGSTINVYVNGAYVGHPTYNVYRADIASLFPGYANTGGAMGYFDLNTTAYADGMHSIYWVATDTGGNADGIGSRFFTISNGSRRPASALQQPVFLKDAHINAMPNGPTVPLKFKTGYREDAVPRSIEPDTAGVTHIRIDQLGRVELHLPGLSAGFMKAGDRYLPLPVGSTLDIKDGIFYWHAGAPFLGDYRFVFIQKGANGVLIKKPVTVSVGSR
ncbi:MAG: hypothetical protein GY950_22760 [bacterium]|nr:hypothetical protein [bacterium]